MNNALKMLDQGFIDDLTNALLFRAKFMISIVKSILFVMFLLVIIGDMVLFILFQTGLFVAFLA